MSEAPYGYQSPLHHSSTKESRFIFNTNLALSFNVPQVYDVCPSKARADVASLPCWTFEESALKAKPEGARKGAGAPVSRYA